MQIVRRLSLHPFQACYFFIVQTPKELPYALPMIGYTVTELVCLKSTAQSTPYRGLAAWRGPGADGLDVVIPRAGKELLPDLMGPLVCSP